MIVLKLTLNKVYGFDDFSIHFTYPKKVVNSIIDEEHLDERKRFRYKKAVVLMGANATGKTVLGKALYKILSYINTGNSSELYEMTDGEKGFFCIDFVNHDFVLHRLKAIIDAKKSIVDIDYYFAKIEKMDSYERCALKLEDKTKISIKDINVMRKMVGKLDFCFGYPTLASSLHFHEIDPVKLQKTLHVLMKTLDPAIKDVVLSKELKDTILIRCDNKEVVIQEGRLLNGGSLSAGTVVGINLAILLTSMFSKSDAFYYCDGMFSYIYSDLEKRIFGLMLNHLSGNGQLILTTHNTDMLELNLPKHSYMFLKKSREEDACVVKAMSASDILKRNTDSIRRAVENDVFESLPDESLLDELE